jgi:hypothetical protein
VRESGFVCEVCGKPQEGTVLDVAFRRPEACLRVPPAERKSRCRESDDLVAVDSKAWFIRGLLELPLTDREDAAALGVWVEVSQRAFDRYVELFDDPAQGQEPPFSGTLATVVPGVPPTEGLPVEIRLTSAKTRPEVRVLDSSHPLARHQAQGLTVQGWLRLRHSMHSSARHF